MRSGASHGLIDHRLLTLSDYKVANLTVPLFEKGGIEKGRSITAPPEKSPPFMKGGSLIPCLFLQFLVVQLMVFHLFLLGDEMKRHLKGGSTELQHFRESLVG